MGARHVGRVQPKTPHLLPADCTLAQRQPHGGVSHSVGAAATRYSAGGFTQSKPGRARAVPPTRPGINSRGTMKRSAEQIEEICRTFASGVSAGILGRRFDVSRNVVIGIVHRHSHKFGIYRRAKYPNKRLHNPVPQRKPEPRLNRKEIVAGLPTSPLPASSATDVPRAALVDLEQHHCRWPCADAGHYSKPVYCGENKVPGLPYCEHHARRAYHTPQPAQRSPDRANHIKTDGRPKEVAI